MTKTVESSFMVLSTPPGYKLYILLVNVKTVFNISHCVYSCMKNHLLPMGRA